MNTDPRRDPNDPRYTNSAERDRAAGGMKEAKGRVRESAGALTGNERLEAQGRSEQVEGATRRKKGRFKDRIKAWIDRL